ncbi:hypothetical protein AH4AK4_2920 [Aeromonas hydrophila 4AK4]|nr:hypothetical protein AH4AK4_2920 [Aeromonas hydrophila 4AK4]
MTAQSEQQKQSEQQAQSEIHRCDKCGERTRHIVVLVARDHSQDIMPKDQRKAFWQAFRASSITNWAFGETLAYQATHVKHLICERCGEKFLEY